MVSPTRSKESDLQATSPLVYVALCLELLGGGGAVSWDALAWVRAAVGARWACHAYREWGRKRATHPLRRSSVIAGSKHIPFWSMSHPGCVMYRYWWAVPPYHVVFDVPMFGWKQHATTQGRGGGATVVRMNLYAFSMSCLPGRFCGGYGRTRDSGIMCLMLRAQP